MVRIEEKIVFLPSLSSLFLLFLAGKKSGEEEIEGERMGE